MSTPCPADGDAQLLKERLADLPRTWDGKQAVLEMKRRGFQWKQMEWMGFYFELLCGDHLHDDFQIPGDKYGNTVFDSFRSVNWDWKVSAIKTDRHVALLNDIAATDSAVRKNGGLGIVLALVDVDYNDDDRSFQQWHTKLKGGLSAYEEDRIARNATSRYRKTAATLSQVLFLLITEDNKHHLGIHAQGKNSNGALRNPKYQLNIEEACAFEKARLTFGTD